MADSEYLRKLREKYEAASYALEHTGTANDYAKRQETWWNAKQAYEAAKRQHG